jgi:hypothetical protein
MVALSDLKRGRLRGAPAHSPLADRSPLLCHCDSNVSPLALLIAVGLAQNALLKK